MKKKLLAFAVLAMLACCLMGCPYLFGSEHTEKHERVMYRHAVQIHKFLDKHFWLYDWDDPHAY